MIHSKNNHEWRYISWQQLVTFQLAMLVFRSVCQVARISSEVSRDVQGKVIPTSRSWGKLSYRMEKSPSPSTLCSTRLSINGANAIHICPHCWELGLCLKHNLYRSYFGPIYKGIVGLGLNFLISLVIDLGHNGRIGSWWWWSCKSSWRDWVPQQSQVNSTKF